MANVSTDPQHSWADRFDDSMEVEVPSSYAQAGGRLPTDSISSDSLFGGLLLNYTPVCRLPTETIFIPFICCRSGHVLPTSCCLTKKYLFPTCLLTSKAAGSSGGCSLCTTQCEWFCLRNVFKF